MARLYSNAKENSEELTRLDKVPNWKTIRHYGPYLIQYEKEPYLGAILYDRIDLHRKYKLNPSSEKAAFLYASAYNMPNWCDPVFIDNYWNDLKSYMDPNQPFTTFSDIDFRDVIEKYKKRCTLNNGHEHKFKHGVVEIDGRQYAASPFAADDMSIYFGEDDNDMNRGKIKRSITAADVTLNLSKDARNIPHISQFKEIVYKKDVNWAAKWNDPITSDVKYMSILFNIPTTKQIVEKYGSDDEERDKDDDIDEGEDDVDYGDDNESSDDEGLFGECSVSSDDDVSELMRARFCADEESTKAFLEKDPLGESINSEDQINPDDFMNDLEEMDLPLSHMVSRKEQYEYALTACKSQFNSVKHMDKVSNYILSLIADAAAIALRNGTANVPEVNHAFMMYAEQRFV